MRHWDLSIGTLFNWNPLPRLGHKKWLREYLSADWLSSAPDRTPSLSVFAVPSCPLPTEFLHYWDAWGSLVQICTNYPFMCDSYGVFLSASYRALFFKFPCFLSVLLDSVPAVFVL